MCEFLVVMLLCGKVTAIEGVSLTSASQLITSDQFALVGNPIEFRLIDGHLQKLTKLHLPI